MARFSNFSCSHFADSSFSFCFSESLRLRSSIFAIRRAPSFSNLLRAGEVHFPAFPTFQLSAIASHFLCVPRAGFHGFD